MRFWRWLRPASVAEQDLQSRLSRLTGALIIVVFCAGLATVAILYARPIYNAAQNWHASRLVAQARALVESGNTYAAVLKAHKAYTIAPDSIAAVRLNAEFLTRMRRPEALYFWDKLASHEPLTEEDEKMRVRALWHADREKEAREQLENLIIKQTADEDILHLAQEVIGSRLLDEAMLAKLKDYVTQNGGDKAARLRLARLQLESSSTENNAEALTSLWQLAEGGDKTSMEALVLLDDYRGLPAGQSSRLIQRLLNHPHSDAQLAARAARRRARLHPDQRQATIAELIEKYRDGKREDLVPVAAWLVEEQAFQQLFTLLNSREDMVLTYQPLLEHYMTALTSLNRLEDLERLLNDQRVNSLLSRSTTSFYRLHLAFLTRQPLEALRRLMHTATLHAEQEGRLETLLAIGQYGEQRAMHDLAATAYRSAMRSQRTYSTALERLLQVTRAAGNSSEHLGALRDAAAEWPDNQDYQERLTYMRLLTGIEMETAARQAEALSEVRSSDSLTNLLVAMSHWRLHREEELARCLQGIEPNRLNHGQLIVLAALSRKAGLSQEARQTTAGVPADAQLFPEERQLFAIAREGLP